MNNGATYCPLCQHKRINKLFSYDRGKAFLCGNCSLLFNECSIVAEQHYDKTYYAHNYYDKISCQHTVSRYFLSLIKQFVTGGSIMDYGCGTAVFLGAAREDGFTHNIGVETSTAALQIALNTIEPPDLLIHSPTQSIPPRRFEVITFIDSFAHIKNIGPVFKNLKEKHLQKNGIVFIKTPSFNTAAYFYTRIISPLLPRELARRLYYLPHRYLIANTKSIRMFLERNNMKLLLVELLRDYPERIRKFSFPHLVSLFLSRGIPRLINPNDSLIVIAKGNVTQ